MTFLAVQMMPRINPEVAPTKFPQSANYDRLYNTVQQKMLNWTTPMLTNMIASLLNSVESDEANWGAIDALTDILLTRMPLTVFSTFT